MYESKLVHLPGTDLSPDVVLHRTLDKIEHIKAVTIVIQWNETDTFDVDWSQMKNSELWMASLVLLEQARETATGK